MIIIAFRISELKSAIPTGPWDRVLMFWQLMECRLKNLISTLVGGRNARVM